MPGKTSKLLEQEDDTGGYQLTEAAQTPVIDQQAIWTRFSDLDSTVNDLRQQLEDLEQEVDRSVVSALPISRAVGETKSASVLTEIVGAM